MPRLKPYHIGSDVTAQRVERDISLFSPSSHVSEGSDSQILEGSTLQIPPRSSPLVSPLSAQVLLGHQAVIYVVTYVSSPAPITLRLAGSSTLSKRKSDLSFPIITKRSRTPENTTVAPTSSEIMAPTPLDSNVQASSILNKQDSRAPSLSSLATFSHANPYIALKGPQAPRSTLPPASSAGLSLTPSLRQKGLEVPSASMQGSGVRLSFPGVVDNIDGGLAAMILDSIPR